MFNNFIYCSLTPRKAGRVSSEPELFALYQPVFCGVRHYLINIWAWPQTARLTSCQGGLRLTLAVPPTPCIPR